MSRQIRQLSEAEWRALGLAMHEAREVLMAIDRPYRDGLPVKLTDKFGSLIDRHDRLRSDLENYMFQHGGPRDIHVFYPAGNRAQDQDEDDESERASSSSRDHRLWPESS